MDTILTAKRMVLLHTDGLMQIFGVEDQQPAEILTNPDGVSINLVAVKPRYYLYKPMLEKPGLKTFNEHQQ